MDWDGIVNSTFNSLFSQEPNHVVPILNADCVDVINVPDAGYLERRNDFRNAIQRPAIVCSVRSAELICSFQMAQFDTQNCCLNSVHSAVPTNHDVMILAVLAVISKDPDLLLQLGIVSHHC